MFVFRWLRLLAKIVGALVLTAPLIALPLAVLFDRGPAGETRVSPHFFPAVLWIFDDFAWTCARNSLIYATLVAAFSLGFGAVIGWVVARRRFWGRGVLLGLVSALLAVTPAFLALGLVGLWGPPRPWPWPLSANAEGTPGVSLESWRAAPLWMVWIWSTLPWGVALVMLVTASSVEQLRPSWADAARLTGLGSFRAWKRLSWPLVRPAAARAGAIVFVFALAEPGAPMILGLRRTLAFQIVELAGRSEPFPAAAVWAAMTGLVGLAGWTIWRWAGGAPILQYQHDAPARSQDRRWPRTAAPALALVLSVLLAAWALFCWLPLAGLVFLAIGGNRLESLSMGESLHATVEQVRRLSDPPVPLLLANSLVLGLEVACATVAIGWLVGPVPRRRPGLNLRARFARLGEFMPPLAQATGFLAIPWLAGLASVSMVAHGGWKPLAVALSSFSAALDPSRNPWAMLSCCVILALAPRFAKFFQSRIPTDRSPAPANSAYDAALLAGASRAQAARLSQPIVRGRWLAGGLLVCALAATNLTPALFFEPWTDGRTIAPAVVVLAAGTPDARSQAAALAICAIAINLTAVVIARAASALPRTYELD